MNPLWAIAAIMAYWMAVTLFAMAAYIPYRDVGALCVVGTGALLFAVIAMLAGITKRH